MPVNIPVAADSETDERVFDPDDRSPPGFQPGKPQRIKQIVLQCAHTEEHPAAKAPDIQPAFCVGSQNHAKNRPDQNGKHKQQFAWYPIGQNMHRRLTIHAELPPSSHIVFLYFTIVIQAKSSYSQEI